MIGEALDVAEPDGLPWFSGITQSHRPSVAIVLEWLDVAVLCGNLGPVQDLVVGITQLEVGRVILGCASG